MDPVHHASLEGSHDSGVHEARASRTLHDEVYAQATVALIGIEGERIAAFNGGAEALFRMASDDALGLPLSELFAVSERGQVDEALQRAARGVPTFRSLVAYRRGTCPTEVDVRVGPLRVGGEVIGATVVILDVRARNRSVRELRAERDRERARANAATDAMGEAREALVRGSSHPSHLAPDEVGAWLEIGRDVLQERETLIPALWLRDCADLALRGRPTRLTSHFSAGLSERYEGPIGAMRRLIAELLQVAGTGRAVLTGSLQARREDWALLRVEWEEPASWARSEAQWMLLRRLATSVEGALGYQVSGDRRRVWMTINLFTRESQPGPMGTSMRGGTRK